MGLSNWLTRRTLQRQAKRIAKWAADEYAETKSSHPDLPESEIHRLMLGADPAKLTEDSKRRIAECSNTIEGISYMMASVSGMMRGWMNFRCLQFTTYIDAELYQRGFSRQSPEMKKRMLKALDLPLDDWKE